MSRKREIPVFGSPLLETHCHLDYLQDEALVQTLAAAQAVGVERIITIAVSPGNLDTVRQLAETHVMVWGTQGIHPHDARDYSDAVQAQIRANAQTERMVAIGEIGLDYYYDHSDRTCQREVFERQLQLAIELDLPIVVHTRDADADTEAILRNFMPGMRQRGVIHSFTSGMALAEYCLGEGFHLGFNGISTFNRADNVREVIAMTPLEQILFETDSPYLTPVPYRGKPNAPCYLPFIAEKVAEVKQVALESLLPQVWDNSLRLFFPAEAAGGGRAAV